MPASPAEWIDDKVVGYLFARLLTFYGARWSNTYAAVPEDALREDWRQRLQGLSREQIAYGVKNLPPQFPPDVAAFRRICQEHRADEPQLITEGLEQNRKRVADEFRRLPAIRREYEGKEGPKAWLRVLRERVARGERLPPAAARALAAMERGEPALEAAPDPAELNRLKDASARRVDEHARRHGLSIELSPEFEEKLQRWTAESRASANAMTPPARKKGGRRARA